MYLAGLCGLMLVLAGLYTLITGGSSGVTFALNTVTSMFNTDMTPETVRFGVRMAEGLRFGVRRPRCIWPGCAG